MNAIYQLQNLIFDSLNNATDYLEKVNKPIVVKADGLAGGKGVYICEDTASAKNAVKEFLKENLV